MELRPSLQQLSDQYTCRQKIIVEWAAFLCLFFALLSYTGLFKTEYGGINILASQILEIIRLAIYVVLAGNLVFDLLKGNISIALFGAAALLFGLVTLFSRSSWPAKTFLLLYGFCRMSPGKTLRIYQGALTVTFLIGLILCAAGVLPNILFDADRMRFSLGFIWVTTSMAFIFFILITQGASGTFSLKPTGLLFLVTALLLLYIVTQARMIFLMIVLYLLIVLCVKKRTLHTLLLKKWVRVTLVCLPWALALIMIALSFLYSPDNLIMAKLDGLLSGRLGLGHAALEQYGLSLFGQKIEWMGFGMGAVEGYNFVDCSYLKFLLDYGILFWAAFMSGFSLLMHHYCLKNDTGKSLALVMVFLLGVIEPYLFDWFLNPFLALMFIHLNDLVSHRISQPQGGLAAIFAKVMAKVHGSRADKTAAVREESALRTQNGGEPV